MSSSKNKFYSIDLLKFIMSFIVIAIHTRPLYNVNNKSITEIYNILIQYAVPFFFLSSGFLIGIKLTKPLNSPNNLSIIKKQLIKIIKMYLIWTLIYSPISIYKYISNGIPFIEAFSVYIKGFVFVGEQYNSWHLWYLLSTIYTLFIIIFLIKKNFSIKQILLVSFIISIISITFTQLTEYPKEFPKILYIISKIIKSSVSNGRIFLGMVYIPLGIYLSKKTLPKYINWPILIICLLLTYFINNKIIDFYLLIISSITFFEIIKNIKLKDNKFYQFARNSSTIIFLIHMYIWTFYYLIVYGKRNFGLEAFIITSIFSTLISMMYIFLKKSIIKRIIASKRKIIYN